MELAAKVEKLENEVAELRQVLADKKEGEKAMLEVVLKVEQEQRIADETRCSAEQQLRALQEKCDKAMASLDDKEKRVVMAETMLEATLQYESGQSKASSLPKGKTIQEIMCPSIAMAISKNRKKKITKIIVKFMLLENDEIERDTLMHTAVF